MGVGHITLQVLGYVKQADKVFYLVADPVTEEFITSSNANCTSLHTCYAEDEPRVAAYNRMIDAVLEAAPRVKLCCVLFYGHPGVFVYPSHRIIRRARQLGHTAEMLPGISTEDCLFADLGVDPASSGCQTFEATDFLIHRRKFDNRSSLILWQVGVIGDLTFHRREYVSPLGMLRDELLTSYPGTHPITVYEAPQFSVCPPRIERRELDSLSNCRVTPLSTLYVPPVSVSEIDTEVAARLGLAEFLVSNSGGE